jgi:acetyl-CoA acyltransferase
MPEAVIVSSVRTPVGRAFKGTLRSTRPDDLGAFAIEGALARVPQVERREIDDVIMGCAMPEAEQGLNVARICALRAGLPVEISAMTVNRFCASGLQTIALATDRIARGGAEVIIAGGTESMSLIPLGGHKVTANPSLVHNYPDAYLAMGLTAERLAQRFGLSRAQADEFSYQSHQKALAAIANGKFADEIVPVPVSFRAPAPQAARQATAVQLATENIEFSVDECPRAETTPQALAALKPSFHAKGTVTAGNSSQMSDAAAAAVVMSDARAASLGLKPLGKLIAFATAGCKPEEMGMGPVYAIPKALKLAGVTLDQIGVIELNEAFAVQALAVIEQAGLDAARVNPNGGAIALGHPLGATGAKLTATILREMKRGGHRYGMVTMCVGGGMGAAGIFENID